MLCSSQLRLSFPQDAPSEEGDPSAAAGKSQLWRVNAFLRAARIDHINLFRLLRFVAESEIGKKLGGFVDKFQYVQTAVSYPVLR